MPAHDEPRTAGARIPLLDGLRGLAVLLVLLSHSSNVRMFLFRHGEYGLDFRGCGRAGVFLFFVLSAFLLTDQALSRPPADLRRGATWGRYLLRRVLRIFPAYLACLLLYMTLEGWGPGRVLEHLATTRAELHFWTVPVELRFYLLLPPLLLLLVPLVRRSALVAPLSLLLAAAIAVRRMQPPDYGSRAPDFAVRLLPFVPVFLAGVAAAVVHDAWRAQPAERRERQAGAWSLASVAALLGLALHAPSVRSLFAAEPVDLHRFHLAFDRFAALWALLLLGLLHGRARLRRPFEARLLTGVGTVSYSAYLFHKLILTRIEVPTRDWPMPLPVLAFLGATLAVAALSWWALERPFARLGRRRTSPTGALAVRRGGR